MRMLFVLILSFHFTSVLCQEYADKDYTTYFFWRDRIINSDTLSVLDKIDFFHRALEKYGTIPPYGYQSLARLYDQINEKDSVIKYLNLALKMGAELDNDIRKAYDLPKLSVCDTCHFNVNNMGKAKLVLYMQSIDASIRKKGFDNLILNKDIDELNVAKLFEENLLAFQNSGYAQFEALVIALHGSFYYKQDTLGLKNYLIGLVKNGELEPSYCAMILDRYYYDLYGYQIYGKVREIKHDEYVFIAPFIAPDRINENRKAIGLLPIEEDLRYEGIKKMSQPQKFKPN